MGGRLRCRASIESGRGHEGIYLLRKGGDTRRAT